MLREKSVTGAIIIMFPEPDNFPVRGPERRSRKSMHPVRGEGWVVPEFDKIRIGLNNV
jgi:hypothetical protein